MYLKIENIRKMFDKTRGIKDINFSIEKGELISFLGPSGCGKTTLLNVIGGFIQPETGKIYLEGEEITDFPPEIRNISTVFQNYALFPHMNVIENIKYGLKYKKLSKKEQEDLAQDYLKIVGLEGYEKVSVYELSGGQQQRVALARALVLHPKLLLLDEPFSNLDAKLKISMREELKQLQKKINISMIFVTHDQEEALTMSDKIVVMREGEIQQIGSPTDIYNEPVNEFVANFIGESNIIEGMMVDDYKVVFGGRRFDCVDNGFGKNEVVDVVIRPEDLDIVPRGEGKLKGVVKSVLFKGVHYETMVETKVGTEITVKMAVSNDSPVYNEAANEKMSANDFYLDMEDVEELDEATIIARADAQAWNPDEDEFISIKEVDYDIKKENGKYPVTFSTAAGTSVTVNMIVKDENRVTSTENEEEIYAMNFFKKVDEIQEAVALDTDLKTWANASAWSLEDDTAVEITDVKYDFDPETITPGIYDVTFATKGYEYKIDTTDKFEVGDEVGLTFQPEDIHIMSKNNY